MPPLNNDSHYQEYGINHVSVCQGPYFFSLLSLNWEKIDIAFKIFSVSPSVIKNNVHT